MVYKVLVVDDSSFFQERLKEMINEHPKLSVIGVAANGREAIRMAEDLQPDIISMDYEMPYLDGVSAVRAILATRQVPIIMFSSLTYEGARITLDALEAGAVDYIPKNFSDVSNNSESLKNRLHQTLLLFAQKSRAQPLQSVFSGVTLQGPQPIAPRASSGIERNIKNKIEIVVIGASTGGPLAVTEVLLKLPAHFPAPVVVVQHMPETFTQAFAERLNKQCALAVLEAKHGDVMVAGKVYIAPGGKQMLFDRHFGIKILAGDQRVSYRPSVDIAFASAANSFGSAVLGIVLTGMGADGREGARLLKKQNATIWAQDQKSCVIYGMPKAVVNANLADEVLPLSEISDRMALDV